MGELKRIQTYLDRTTAENVKNFLGAYGIEAILSTDDAGGVRPELTLARGVKLWVREEDEKEARELLREGESEDAAGAESKPEESAGPVKGFLSQFRQWLRGQ